MKVISLFSGIGGSSEGYIADGNEVVAAVEFLDYQAETYRVNHPETKVYEEDIRKLDPLKILEDVGLNLKNDLGRLQRYGLALTLGRGYV